MRRSCTRQVQTCAALAGTLALSACKFAYTWRSLGPFETSGVVRHLIVDPVRAQRLYAASENGGLWVLDDATNPAAGWRPLSDNLENLQMRGVAKSSVDSAYIVTANALGFVYHTRDHGGTWSRILDQSFSYIRRLLIAEGLTRIPAGNYTRLAKETTVLVAGRTGLHRLRLVNNQFDRVDTLFPRLPAHGPDVLDLARDPVNPQLFYIGVRNQGIWRTGDAGENWQLVATWAAFGDPNSAMIKIATNGQRVVAKFGGNILVHDAGGDSVTWRATNAVGFADDGGSDIGYRGNYSAVRGEWVHAVAIHPSDTSVIAIGQAGLVLTEDGGSTWVGRASGHEDIQALAFSPDGARLYIANDGGVWTGRVIGDSLAGLVSLNTRLTTLQFYRAAKNGSAVIGNADHQGIRGTRNIEANPPVWEYATRGSSGYGNNSLENDFVFADPRIANRFYLTFQEQDLLRLRYPPTGATQDLLAMNDTSVRVRPFVRRTNNAAVTNMLNYAVGTVAFDPRANSNILLLSAHQNVNTSWVIRLTRNRNVNPTGGPRTDCGDSVGATICFTQPLQNTATWSLSHGPVNRPVVSIAFSPTETRRVYALLENGRGLAKVDIDDSTTAWDTVGVVPLEPNGVARQLLTDRTTAGRLYALSHGGYFVSSDSGVTWNRRGAASLDTMQLNALVQHPTRSSTLYVATARDVRVSDDGGTEWRSIGATLPNAAVMQLFTDATYVYAVTFGRGLWRAKMPQ